ncbi:MAG: GtrA family protein [Clostridia bacterium]|jgi:putative flippase GtrA
MEKLKELIKKVCTKEVIFYGIFGILTTLVNLGVFYVLNTFTPLGENFSNNIAIITAVLFAYFTNRNMVFHSKAANAKQKWMEFFKFLLGRAATMVIESVGCAILFAFCPIPPMVSKCIMTIIVIILNFFISKFFAFKK